MLIAIDFDGTICRDEFPFIGAEKAGSIRAIKELIKDGHKILIWTCREGENLKRVHDFLILRGIREEDFLLNQNSPGTIALFGVDSRKIGADVYIDDKGINGIPDWYSIPGMITEMVKRKVKTLLNEDEPKEL